MTKPTLCLPDTEKNCFACCPPIRPAGYEHLQHTGIVKRMLRENTRAFAGKGAAISPITGFSC
ncbi:MAG: hypothetical protein ISS61_02540 [Desulfobacteraceae bacterium]|nr:hypothetical protein [Desulfobacteraceae bacterium]